MQQISRFPNFFFLVLPRFYFCRSEIEEKGHLKCFGRVGTKGLMLDLRTKGPSCYSRQKLIFIRNSGIKAVLSLLHKRKNTFQIN